MEVIGFQQQTRKVARLDCEQSIHRLPHGLLIARGCADLRQREQCTCVAGILRKHPVQRATSTRVIAATQRVGSLGKISIECMHGVPVSRAVRALCIMAQQQQAGVAAYTASRGYSA